MSVIPEPASAGAVFEPVFDTAPADAGEHSAAAEPTDQPAAPAPAESVHEYLMRSLSEEEPAADVPAEPAVTDEPPATVPVGEPADEPPADDPSEKEPSDPADPEKPDSDTPPSLKIVSKDEIEEQFKRAPKEIREVAAANAEAALHYQKQLESFGGEHFAEPMQQIAKGLLEDDNVHVIHGILAAQGVDGFTGLMKDILQVALVDTHSSDPTEEGAKYLKAQCEAITAELFQARFGENASPALIEKLLKYEAEGLLNTEDVDTYKAENGDGPAAKSPLIKEKEERIAELERKLAESEATETDATLANERRFVESWTSQTFEESAKSLDDLYFKHSVLKPVKGDSPEMKAGKEQVKSLLLDAAREFQKADPSFKKLQASAYKGNTNTAKYKTEKAALVENTVFHAKKLAAPLEALVSQIYTLGRNNNLPAPGNPASAASPAEPTEPKIPTQTTAPEKKPMTREQYRAYMEAEIAKG